MARGQIIIEFVIIIAIAMLIGVVYLAVSSSILSSKTEEQRIIALNDVGYTVQDELMLAGTVQDGYQRAFTIPQKAGRFSYALSNDDTTLTLVSGSDTLTYPLPKINGTLVQGKNVVFKNGSIVVNP